MNLLYNIFKVIGIIIGIIIVVYFLSKIVMVAWLEVIEKHFTDKITKSKKEDYGNKEK
jgi:hypothetical protein